MATSQRSVTESIKDDFLTCNICLEVYTDPRILPCLHTYCFRCVRSHVEKTKGEGRPPFCPECRAPVREEVRSLKKNFFVKGLAQVIKEKSVDRLYCTACRLRGSEVAAKSKCLHCGDYLCSSCSDGHNSSSLTWKHEKVLLDDIKDGKYDEKLRQLQKIRCPKHETKDVELYCETCAKTICMICIHLEHRKHTYKTIPKATAMKRPTIVYLTEKHRKRFTSFEKEEKALTKEIGSLKGIVDLEQKSIVSTAERDVRSIISKRDSKLERLALSTRTVTENLERKLDFLRQETGGLGNCIRFSDGILGKGKDEEVLMLESMLTERLVQLQETFPAAFVSDLENNTRQTPNKKTDKQNDEESDPTSSHQKPLVTLTHVKTLSTKSITDKEKQDIKGMAYSPKLGLVVSDHLNGKLKIISETGDLIKVITKSDFHPHAVAVAGNHIGTINGNSLLIFTSKGDISAQVELTKKVPDRNLPFTYCLAASETGNIGFVVGNIVGEDRLRFYSTNGVFRRYMYCSVKCPLVAMSVTPNFNLVLSEWGSGQLRAITPDGKLVFSICKRNWTPHGTCMSRGGVVYIADYSAGGISAYNVQTEALEVIYKTKSDGISSPQFLVLGVSELLYVTDSSGKICVYKCSC